jgi:Carboxypeptidase regulatory-like domain
MNEMSRPPISRVFALLAIGLMLVCLQAALSAQAPGDSQSTLPGGPFRVAGIVFNKIGGHPLAGARVALADTRNRQSAQSVVTSEDGRFIFQVRAGKYSLEAAKRGFIPAFYNQHQQFSTAIVTGAGFDTENLALQLAPDAVLSGKVLDESGARVRHATVTVYRESRQSGVSVIRAFRQATTDDQGTYEVTPLDEGNYFVSARAKPWYAVHPVSTQQGEGALPYVVEPSLDVAYQTTYYGDATEADDALPIPIRGGDRVEVDIHLTPVPALHLLVHVSDSGTHGFNLPTFEQTAFDGMDDIQVSNPRMISQGIFEMTGIPAGRYSVRTFSPDGQMKEPTEIDLTSNAQELDISSGIPTSTVKAAVGMAGDATLPSPLTVALRNGKGRVVAQSNVDAHGEITFQDVIAGQYTLLAGSPTKPYSVKIASASGTAGKTLNVPAGSSLDVTLVLVGGEVTVEGIAKQAGKPVSGAMVVLVPKDPESNRELFRRDQSDQDGTFSLLGVIPGRYTVIAIENGWDLDWAKPAILAQYTKRGQSITVGSRANGAMQLPDPVEVQPK